jgi:hypothetical protein
MVRPQDKKRWRVKSTTPDEGGEGGRSFAAERDPNEVLHTDGGSITVGELHSRCTLLEPGIICIRHPSFGSAETFTLLVERAVELARPSQRFAIVNDLTESKQRPRGAYQEAIIDMASSVGVHWANVWPSSAFTRVVARFIGARLMRPSGKAAGVTWSFHDSFDDARQAARNALTKAGGP